jgi:hypothetical protein
MTAVREHIEKTLRCGVMIDRARQSGRALAADEGRSGRVAIEQSEPETDAGKLRRICNFSSIPLIYSERVNPHSASTR